MTAIRHSIAFENSSLIDILHFKTVALSTFSDALSRALMLIRNEKSLIICLTVLGLVRQVSYDACCSRLLLVSDLHGLGVRVHANELLRGKRLYIHLGIASWLLICPRGGYPRLVDWNPPIMIFLYRDARLFIHLGLSECLKRQVSLTLHLSTICVRLLNRVRLLLSEVLESPSMLRSCEITIDFRAQILISISRAWVLGFHLGMSRPIWNLDWALMFVLSQCVSFAWDKLWIQLRGKLIQLKLLIHELWWLCYYFAC